MIIYWFDIRIVQGKATAGGASIFSFFVLIEKEKKSTLILITRKKERNLYKLGNLQDVPKDPIRIGLLVIVAPKKGFEIKLWNKKLGHVDIEKLKLLHVTNF